MKLTLIIANFLSAIVCVSATASPQVDSAVNYEKKITVNTAEKVAIKEFKKRSKTPATRVSVRLLEENDRDWVFVVEDAEQLPAPGSELYVTVSKKTAKTASYFGK